MYFCVSQFSEIKVLTASYTHSPHSPLISLFSYSKNNTVSSVLEHLLTAQLELPWSFLLRFYFQLLCLINNSETALFLLWVFLPRFGTAKMEGRGREGSEPGFGSHWPRLRSQTAHSGRSLVWQSVSWSVKWGLAGGSVVKESACNVGDTVSIPWLGRSCGVGSGNPLQYSCLGNPMDRGAWRGIVHGITSQTWLSD